MFDFAEMHLKSELANVFLSCGLLTGTACSVTQDYSSSGLS